MSLDSLRNFRAKTLPSSPTHINVKDLLSAVYGFLDLWNLLLVQTGSFLQSLLRGVHYYHYHSSYYCEVVKLPLAQKIHPAAAATTTTTSLFGKVCTLDISPTEFPSPEEIDRMENVIMPTTTTGSPCHHRHGWIPSSVAYGGQQQQLHYRYFLPTHVDKPKAVIVWMHGLQGFGGEAHILKDDGQQQQKTNMALQVEAYCVKEGYALFAMDMLGHGFSEGKRWFMPNGDVMLADAIRFVQHIVHNSFFLPNNNNDDDDKQRIPLFLSGYSYGGCLALRTAKYFQDHPSEAPKMNFRGILLQAPAIYDLEGFFLFPLAVWLTRTILDTNLLGPTFTPPDWVPNRVHPRRFWRSPERYRVGMTRGNNGSLNAAGRHIPMQTCLTLIEDMVTLRNDTIPNLRVPFCVVHGQQDKVVPLTGSHYLMRASLTARNDRAFQCFPEAYHDLLGEPEANDVMEFQINWIKERLRILEREQQGSGM